MHAAGFVSCLGGCRCVGCVPCAGKFFSPPCVYTHVILGNSRRGGGLRVRGICRGRSRLLAGQAAANPASCRYATPRGGKLTDNRWGRLRSSCDINTVQCEQRSPRGNEIPSAHKFSLGLHYGLPRIRMVSRHQPAIPLLAHGTLAPGSTRDPWITRNRHTERERATTWKIVKLR